MSKEKLRRIIFYALIIFIGLALSITYFFFLYKYNNVEETVAFITSVLRPFIIGGVIAYVMKSTCNFFEKHLTHGFLRSGKRNAAAIKKPVSILSVIITYIIWIAVLVSLLWIVIPQLVQSIISLVSTLYDQLPTYYEKAKAWVDGVVESNPTFGPYIQSIFDNSANWFGAWIEDTVIPALMRLEGGALTGIVNVVSVIIDTFIGIVISVFFLSGRKIFAEKCKLFVHCLFKEKTANVIIDEFRYADRMFSGFLEGKVIDSAIIGILYYIALVIMDVPYAPLVAVICGVTNIIPIFGPFIGAVPSGLIILAEEPVKVIYFVIFVCIMQFIDANIIDPHIVGGNIKMSSFSVLFAVILFGGLWGFMGLLVGVPTFAVIYDIGKKLAYFILKKRGKQDMIDKFNLDFNNDKPLYDKKKKEKKKAAATVKAETAEGNDSDNGEEKK